MEALILDSAYKHGITKESIKACLFNLDTDSIVEEVYKAEAEGRTRPMTRQELMRIRLAGLSAIVKDMQETVEKDHELSKVYSTVGV